ncbi:Cytochrome P450 E-class group I protein [Dioscorea alata]|uniref:Cytochrome P450 E-class group I protein n=1 Tax=Dioscorea alata TaxID=55571 RepID=A0ACB7WGQ2_DIOAL|nr:Cytochrome P450 E-class group I protein [Dioscorea alata]
MKMDFLQIASSMIGGLFTILFLCKLSLLLSNKISNKKESHLQEPPQPSGALPIIGHLHLLKRRRSFVLYLADLADELGPIFTLRVGSRRIVILSNSETAKDSYTTSDKALSNRPNSTIGDLMGYNRSMIVFAPYGPYWRAVRRIATTELLSNSHLNALSRVVIKEFYICNKCLFSQYTSNNMQPIKVEMMSWLGDINYNVVIDMIVSKLYFHSGNGGVVSEDFSKFRKALKEFVQLIGAFIPGDIFPFLKWLDFGGYKKVMRSAFRDIDAVMSALLEDHKQRRLFRKESDDLDFMDVVLTAMDDPEFSEYDQDAATKATCLSMIMGGTHTTTLYLIWTLALLLNNRPVMDKVRSEIDEKVGKERLVEQSDIKNLVYWSAVVKEAFRLCPAGELMVSREASEDCQISGYHIPKGHYVAVNVWKVQRDPVVWPDPLEFKPERFLTTHKGIDVIGQHYELLPFRAGRRGCPGGSFSIQVMDLVLTRLIQAFDLETLGKVPVEMNQSLGLLKAKSMEVMLTPRLSPTLYG